MGMFLVVSTKELQTQSEDEGIAYIDPEDMTYEKKKKPRDKTVKEKRKGKK